MCPNRKLGGFADTRKHRFWVRLQKFNSTYKRLLKLTIKQGTEDHVKYK